MLAFCPNCKIVFSSNSISLGKGSIGTIENIGVSCPNNSNHNAFLLDGTFATDENGTQRIISAPKFTQDIFNALRELTLIAQKENYSAEEYFNEVKKISPEAASFFEKGFSKGTMDIITFLGLIATLYFGYKSLSDGSQQIIQTNTTINNNYYSGSNVKQKGSNYTPPKKKRRKRRN